MLNDSRECGSWQGQSRTSKPLPSPLHPKYRPPTPTGKRTRKRCRGVQQKCLEQHSYRDLSPGESRREWKEGFIVCEETGKILPQAGPGPLFAWPGEDARARIAFPPASAPDQCVGSAQTCPCLTVQFFSRSCVIVRAFSLSRFLASQGISRPS